MLLFSFSSIRSTHAESTNYTLGGGGWYLGDSVDSCGIHWYNAPVNLYLPTNIDSGDDIVSLKLELTDLTSTSSTSFNSIQVNGDYYDIDLAYDDPVIYLDIPVGDTRYIDHVDLNVGKISFTGCNSGLSLNNYSQNAFTVIVDDFLILENSSPRYVDTNKTIFSNVSSPTSIEQILQNIAVFDDVDGDLSDQIRVVLDEFTPNKFIVGEYHVTLSVSDSDGNVSNLLLTVKVVDVDNPVISGVHDIYVDINTPSIDYYEDIELTDNYDQLTNFDLEIDFSDVDLGSYGIYEVIYYAEDSSGNYVFQEINVHVKDITFPVIEGVSTVVKRPEDIFFVTDIVNDIVAYDNILGDLTDEIYIIEDEYTGFGDLIGTYKVIFGVIDNFDNESTLEVDITVTNNIPVGVYMINDDTIFVPNDYLLTPVDFLDVLKFTDEIDPTKDYSVTLLKDRYSPNYKNPDSYSLEVKIVSNSGIFYSKVLTVNVIPKVDYTFIEGEVPFWNSEIINTVPNYLTIPIGLVIVAICYLAYKKI